MMMFNKFCAGIILLVASQTVSLAAEAFDPVFRYWYSADGNYWADCQLHSVQADSEGMLAVVLKRANGNFTQQIRVDKLSDADRAYVQSAIKLRSGIESLCQSEFVGAVSELDKVRAGMKARSAYFRGLSSSFLETELRRVARARARFGELREVHQDFAPNLAYATFGEKNAQFMISDIRFSAEHAGIERITLVTDSGRSYALQPEDFDQVRLLPDWLPDPRFQVLGETTPTFSLVSKRAPREFPTGEGYLVRPDKTRKIWTTGLETEAYEKLDASNRLWFDTLELERPYAVRRLVKMGDQYCEAKDFNNGMRAYREAIRIGKPRPDINLRLAYAEFGLGVESEGSARRTHYSTAKQINDDVSGSSEASQKILLASRYLGAWISAGIGGESGDDNAAFNSFDDAIKSASSVATELSEALAMPDTVSDVSPALRVFLLAKTSGLQELKKYAYANMEKRCNLRLVNSIARWVLIRQRPSLNAYNQLLEELAKIRSISFSQPQIDTPAWEMSIRGSSEGAKYAFSVDDSHLMHQNSVKWVSAVNKQLLPATIDTYLVAEDFKRVVPAVTEFLNSERGQDKLGIWVQKRGRTDMCEWLTKALASARASQESVLENLSDPVLNELPHEKWSENALGQQFALLTQIEQRLKSLGDSEAEAAKCKLLGSNYEYPLRERDVLDEDLTQNTPAVSRAFLRRATSFHNVYSAFWSEQDKYFDALYFLTRSANTKNQLVALESASPSDR